ncbi:hypothetical protein O181_109484 [Austropuccinia psidii MF-1]|uniref:Uncharacterized protein n=1 Tax=Austropuccinia psidii MF-1 TaxID=1389203 RepID=A0A9Q3JY66_9BASI|nr:hypothetical protein [Austropuccinia psidii MF-1]
MKEEEFFRRGCMKCMRSRLFHGLLGGYPGNPQGPKGRLGEDEDEEGENSVKDEDSMETEVKAPLKGSPEAPEAPNIAIYNKPIVSQAEPNLLKIIKKMTQLIGQLTQVVSPRED